MRVGIAPEDKMPLVIGLKYEKKNAVNLAQNVCEKYLLVPITFQLDAQGIDPYLIIKVISLETVQEAKVPLFVYLPCLNTGLEQP